MTYDPAEQIAARRQLRKLLKNHRKLRREVRLSDLIARLPEARSRYGRTDWKAILREMQSAVRTDTAST